MEGATKTMRGVILAAGRGSRLNGGTEEMPKCLAKVGGMSLIERQIAVLHACGVRDIAVVVGCEAETVRRACGIGIRYVENPDFASTNSLYSLWLARHLLSDGAVILNCDVLLHPRLLDDLMTSPYEDAMLIAYRDETEPPFGEEEMKVTVRRGCVTGMSKQMDPAIADGENVGVLKFGRDGARLLVPILDRIVRDGGTREWAPRAFGEFASRRALHAIGTRGLPWTEIDFPEDYQRAITEILPAIEADARSADVSESWDAPSLAPTGTESRA
jgi:choline kinase